MKNKVLVQVQEFVGKDGMVVYFVECDLPGNQGAKVALRVIDLALLKKAPAYEFMGQDGIVRGFF